MLHFAYGDNALSVPFLHDGKGGGDVLRRAQRRGGLEKHEGIEPLPALFVAAQDLTDRRFGGGGIRGGLRAAEKGLVRAVLPRKIGIAGRIGRDMDRIEAAGGQRRLHRVGQKWLAAQRQDIFVRKALGTAPGGNDGNRTHGRSSLFRLGVSGQCGRELSNLRADLPQKEPEENVLQITPQDETAVDQIRGKDRAAGGDEHGEP